MLTRRSRKNYFNVTKLSSTSRIRPVCIRGSNEDAIQNATNNRIPVERIPQPILGTPQKLHQLDPPKSVDVIRAFAVAIKAKVSRETVHPATGKGNSRILVYYPANAGITGVRAYGLVVLGPIERNQG